MKPIGIGPQRMLRSLLALTSAFALGGATQAAEGSFEFDRTVLPITQEPFKGTIGTSIATSVPHRPEPVRAPEGAPNILVVMTDDVGFGTPSAFGGPVPTPNLDRLSADGFRFNRFHTTAVCSPTRAALLTGRNAHNAGTGELSDSGIPFPGYRGVIPRETATIARVLRDNGYNTAMFGKHHNLPGELQSAAGPFDSWPTGLGFEYFYGFLGGDVSQWEPRLYRHTSLANDAEWTGRHLDWRLASDAIRWVHNQKAAAPEKPFFMYYAPGTLHAPHHAPPEMIARFRGRFDKGWDVQREETHRRQLAAGIIPRGTALTPRPTAIPAWSSLSAQEKAYQAKLMEVAAATLAYQDEQFGRILAELERMGELDRTLVVFIEGDNGASGEATTVGTTNELGALLNGVVDTPASMSREIDRMGGPETYQNYSLGWAWAMNAPFKWAKQFPNFLGGTRNGMIMRWPAGTQARPGIRSQFSHVIDVAPTLLAAARLPAPQRVDGIQQKPLDGINLLRSVEGAPEIPRTQYFEMAGARAIYKNGWLANTTARRMPWQFTLPPEVAAEPQGWELYDLSKDFSQSRDLAVHYPSKLTELQRAFEEEARRNNVYPIDELFAKARLAAVPNVRQGGRVEHVYWSADVSVAQGAALSLAGRSFEVVGDLLVSDRTSGVIAATGSRFGGWSFFLEGGRPVAVHAFSTKPEEVFRIASERVLPAGQQSIRFQFVSGTGLGAGGELSIYAGDELIAKGSIGRTILAAAGIGETFDIGRDTGAPVTQYQRPEGFFDGIIKKVTVSVAPRG